MLARGDISDRRAAVFDALELKVGDRVLDVDGAAALRLMLRLDGHRSQPPQFVEMLGPLFRWAVKIDVGDAHVE